MLIFFSVYNRCGCYYTYLTTPRFLFFTQQSRSCKIVPRERYKTYKRINHFVNWFQIIHTRIYFIHTHYYDDLERLRKLRNTNRITYRIRVKQFYKLILITTCKKVHIHIVLMILHCMAILSEPTFLSFIRTNHFHSRDIIKYIYKNVL